MKRRLKGFIWIGLGISLLLALFLSPFASSSPDGLEKVAETKGFLEKAEGWKFWKYAPFSDYAIPWIKNEKVSTALSGLIGTLAIFFLAIGIGKIIRKSPNQKTMIFVAFPFMIFSTLIFTSTFLYAARPLTTDDAWTVEKGKFQLETGFDAARQDNHDQELGPSVTLSYGLLERMDLGLGSGYIFLDPKEGERENGFADTELKAKYRLFDEKDWIPAFAISGTLKIPTASESKGLGSGEADFGINAIATKNLSKKLALHLNLGYTFIGENHVDNELNYSLGCQFTLTEKWALVGEVVGVNNLNGRKGDDPLSSLIGTYYLISDNLVLDAGIEIGVSKAAPDFRITTGLTWFFKP
jgi:cobalt/nickel transport protein